MKDLESVGIIGYGAFGSLVHTLLTVLAPHIEVKVFSIDKEIDNKTFFSLEEVCVLDVVILAVPIRVYEAVIEKIIPLIQKHTVVVDIATVKRVTLDALKKHAKEVRYVSLHPMFGPQSFAKRGNSIDGFRVVVCDYTIEEEEYKHVREFLSAFGLIVFELDADEHDKLLAETLFLTHYIGQVVKAAGFTRTTIDTVSFQFLMDAVESVASDGALFRDVYIHNPHCKEVIEKLVEARRKVEKDILSIEG